MNIDTLKRTGFNALNTKWHLCEWARKPLLGLAQFYVNSKNNSKKKLYSHVKPESVTIEVTTCCNSRCVFCPQGTGDFTRNRENMSLGRFSHIIDICRKEGIESVSFSGIGEPLCDKDFFKKLEYVQQNDLSADSLTTNAMLLDKEVAERIINSGIKRLNISLDSVDKSRYEDLRKGLSFERVNDNILSFLDKNLKGAISVTINAVIYDDNVSEKNAFIKKFQKYIGPKLRLTFYPAHNWSGLLDTRGSAGRLKTYCSRVFSKDVLISVDGEVSICCLDYNNTSSLGRIEDSITGLWNSPKIKEIRNKHLEGLWDDIDICRNCSEIVMGKSVIEEIRCA